MGQRSPNGSGYGLSEDTPRLRWIFRAADRLTPSTTPKERPDFSQVNATRQRTRLARGGLEQGRAQKFDSVQTEDVSDDWPYHAASSVILAHSLLRSFSEVDAERTAVTGISWGGYTTCLVASLDHRFQAAVPVYGCGFLHEGESVQKPAIDGLGEDGPKWVASYDVSSWLPQCQVPIFFVNGTNDQHYVLDSYQKSFDVVPGDKQMRIQVMMRHGHAPGWRPQEIGLFIDSKCRNGTPLPKLGSVAVVDGQVHVEYDAATTVKDGKIHYTTDTGPRVSRTLERVGRHGSKRNRCGTGPTSRSEYVVCQPDR